VTRFLLAAAIVALCSVQARAGGVEYDQAGNRYPVACMGDLSSVKSPVMFVAPAVLQALSHSYNLRELGAWLPPSMAGKPGVILVDNTLRGWKRDDAVRHERCHERMYELTGDARWHQ
jgi:hypothetical protein